jgi:hypothetical protein
MEKRITIIVGHFGSGKSEFSINLALDTVREGKKTALIDLDIANPYFRSRERQELLESNGCILYSNIYHKDITVDLPAIDPAVRTPLEDKSCHAIVDAGGDETGARVLNQFRKYLIEDDAQLWMVVNANRPETSDFKGAMDHILRIHSETGIALAGIVNNTHMLRETTVDDILRGYELSKALAVEIGVPVVANTCVKPLVAELTSKNKELYNGEMVIYPIELYLRPTWLDR